MLKGIFKLFISPENYTEFKNSLAIRNIVFIVIIVLTNDIFSNESKYFVSELTSAKINTAHDLIEIIIFNKHKDFLILIFLIFIYFIFSRIIEIHRIIDRIFNRIQSYDMKYIISTMLEKSDYDNNKRDELHKKISDNMNLKKDIMYNIYYKNDMKIGIHYRKEFWEKNLLFYSTYELSFVYFIYIVVYFFLNRLSCYSIISNVILDIGIFLCSWFLIQKQVGKKSSIKAEQIMLIKGVKKAFKNLIESENKIP